MIDDMFDKCIECGSRLYDLFPVGHTGLVIHQQICTNCYTIFFDAEEFIYTDVEEYGHYMG